MKLQRTPFALAVLALVGALPAGAQTSAVTVQAESMTRKSYVVEGGNRIKLSAASGSASTAFAGNSGTYDIQVFVIAETDGQPTLDLYRDSTKLRSYTYPRSNVTTSFTVKGVALNKGQTIRLDGRANGDAWARVDKIVLTPTTGAPVPPPVTNPPPADTSACANPAGGYQGFGKNTTGGTGKPTYRVTNLNDSGAGSLRDAVSQGNRCVVFDVGGTISLSSNLMVRGANLTIDGLTAPSPGITLRNKTLVMQGSSGAGNLVVRGIRHRGAGVQEDAIRVYGASNIVIDRVSVSGYGDGAIDVTESARNVTIQWSILGAGTEATSKATLIAYNASRISIHRCLYAADTRNPRVAGTGDASPLVAGTIADVRNNLIHNFQSGTQVTQSTKANVVNNYYDSNRAYSSSHAIDFNPNSQVYASGNFSKQGWQVNSVSNRPTAFDADAVTTTDALTAAREVLAKAGARGARFGLDSTDQGYVGSVSLP